MLAKTSCSTLNLAMAQGTKPPGHMQAPLKYFKDNLINSCRTTSWTVLFCFERSGTTTCFPLLFSFNEDLEDTSTDNTSETGCGTGSETAQVEHHVLFIYCLSSRRATVHRSGQSQASAWELLLLLLLHPEEKLDCSMGHAGKMCVGFSPRCLPVSKEMVQHQALWAKGERDMLKWTNAMFKISVSVF